jgi:hypothetical protein
MRLQPEQPSRHRCNSPSRQMCLSLCGTSSVTSKSKLLPTARSPLIFLRCLCRVPQPQGVRWQFSVHCMSSVSGHRSFMDATCQPCSVRCWPWPTVWCRLYQRQLQRRYQTAHHRSPMSDFVVLEQKSGGILPSTVCASQHDNGRGSFPLNP